MKLSSFFKQPHCIEMTNRLFLKQEVAEMANEDKKDFNAMLHDNKDMPKFQIITDQKSIEKYGGSKMYFAPPIDYDKVMKKIPYGKVITVGKIREYFAELSSADFTEPITAGGNEMYIGERDIGETIRILRTERGISREELAERV